MRENNYYLQRHFYFGSNEEIVPTIKPKKKIYFFLPSKSYNNIIIQQVASKTYSFEQEAYLNKANALLVYNYY
jgi:hypothetical protein